MPAPNLVLAQSETLEEVVVTGYRHSLKQAREIKREAEGIVDAISAEDIGKFPNQNLAESLQRISGVQISRDRGEGRDVTIRGLSPDFTRVQYNGRTLPSASGGRNFDFTILPSDFVSTIEVHKTPTADLEEGALSATVNVRTLRPLEVGKRKIVVSLKGVQEENAGDTESNFSVLYNDVFANGAFGMTLGAHYDKRSVESHLFEAFGLENGTENSRSPTENLDYNLDGDFDDSVRFNHASNFSQLQEVRERQTFIANFQWRPSDNMDMWFEVLNSEFEVEGEFPLNSFRWTNVIGSVTDSNIINDPLGSDGFANFLEIAGVDNRNNSRTTDTHDELMAFSLGGTYILGDWTIEAEASYGKSERSETRLAHELLGRANASYDLRLDPGGIHQVEYTPGFDSLDGANFRSIGFNGNLDEPTEDENADFRVDFSRDLAWKVGNDFSFEGVEFGAKYSTREKFNGFRNLTVSAEALAGILGETYDPDIEKDSGGSFDASPYLTLYNPSNFFDGYDGSASFPTTWLTASTSTILNQVPLSTLIANGLITEGGPTVIDVEEAVLAAYAKLKFEGSDGKLSGNIGVRIVQTDQKAAGNVPDFATVDFNPGGAGTSVDSSESSVSRSYTEVLPSFSLRYEITEDVILRFGAARVMSRPSLNVLSTATTIDVNTRSIRSSNPDLDPFLADQIDLSLEWYMENGGLISVSPFAKYIESFVVSATSLEQVTYTTLGANAQTENFTRFLPDSGRGSDLYGFEINWHQPLDMIVQGLGLQANFTAVTADDIQTADGGPLLPLDGLSETSYNLVAYYENDRFGARLAYNFRDGFVNSGTNYFGDGSFTEGYKQLDLSASYNINANISVVFEALNITEEVLVQTNSLGVNRGLEDIGRRLTFGVRAQL